MELLETEKIIARNKTSEIGGHLNNVEYEVPEFKVSNKQQMENFKEWSNQLEEKVLRYDVLVDKLKNKVRAAMKKEDLEKQKEEEEHEEMIEDGLKKSWKSRRRSCKFRRGEI